MTSSLAGKDKRGPDDKSKDGCVRTHKHEAAENRALTRVHQDVREHIQQTEKHIGGCSSVQ